MRPHKLTISAFLAFGGEVEIDFDKLYERGLFLVFGETGAGKTSIFDAMAYAIYGQVPGSRSADKKETYRSLHAKPETKTFVELDATVAGKRYQIRRNPDFLRPKVKGDGFAKEPAKTLVNVWKDGDWEPLVGQHGSAEKEILDWIKLKSDQFFKLVLLPQGEFAAFLKSKGKERSDILMNLFDVRTYKGIQTWFQDTESSLNDLVTKSEIEIGNLHAAINQIVGDSGLDVSDSIKIANLVNEYKKSIPSIEKEVDALKAQFDEATNQFTLANKRMQELNNMRTARSEFSKAQEAWQEFRQVIVEFVSTTDLDDDVKSILDSKRDILRSELQEHNNKKEKIEALASKRVELSSLQSSELQALKVIDESQLEIDSKVEAQEKLEDLRNSLETASINVTKAESELEEVTKLEVEFKKIPELEKQVSDLEKKLHLAKQEEEEILKELNEAFKLKIELQASELAAVLLPGDSCPVCGSISHPNPATKNPAITVPDIEKIDQRRALNKEIREKFEGDLAKPSADLVAIRGTLNQSGIDTLELLLIKKLQRESNVQSAAEQKNLAKKAQADYERIANEITSARTRNATAFTKLDNARARIPIVKQEIRELESGLSLRPDEIPILPDSKTLEDAVGNLQRHISKTENLLTDINTKGAILNDREKEFKGDPEEIVEVDVLEANKSRAEENWSLRNQELIQRKQTIEELEKKKNSLKELEENLLGRKRNLDRHKKMSLFITGNTKPRVPLVNYYLAAKLQQVLQQANTRLREITDNRYTLMGNASKVGRGQQSLALEVHDSWNGERRSTESLSGGETFVCSLALALGLADSTKQVTTLESLFIDEGFGTLDQNYLNNVMNSLDRLRSSSGRLVGLVSHVTELRSRIPTRIHVVKGDRGGSTIDPQY